MIPSFQCSTIPITERSGVEFFGSVIFSAALPTSHINPGNHKTNAGKAIIAAMATASQARKGNAAL